MGGIYNNELKALLETIEALREELHHIVKQGKSTLDPFVLKLSQDLDENLNKYYRMTLLKVSNEAKSPTSIQ